MKRGISGYTFSHNCVKLDYPIFECIASMLPVCDEVVVSDAGSTDGTLEAIKLLAEREAKLRLVHHPKSLFPNGEQVFNNWVEAVRKELDYDMQFMLDGDEILDPRGFAEMRQAVDDRKPRIFNYVNFWLDAQHMCPWGDSRKLHLMRTSQSMHAHGCAPHGFDLIRANAKSDPSLITYHYSALRKRPAFFAKCRVMAERSGLGYADQALLAAEKDGSDFMMGYPDRVASSVPFTGEHPAVIRNWLLERGWKL
jgi:glycosyltransferase involved in cell wall biosynthesis